MSERAMSAPAGALEAKQQLAKSFRIKGIFIGVLSGFLYGGYTAFMTQGMAEGIWADWYAPTAALSAFAGTYVLSAVGAATNDICSAVWSIIYAAIIGRLGDFGRSLRTKPGKILIIAAIIGGPLASTAYVVGLQMAGSIIIPIAALNAAIGAIIGRIIYKQSLSGGMIAGIVICFGAAVLIGSTGFTGDMGFSGTTIIGIIAGFCAALGWGIEGAVGGYACAIVDYEVAIVIRQCTSGLVNGVILVSILSLIGGDGIGSGLALVGQALTDGPSIWLFFIGGVFASFSFKFWYKGASMCGAALGMGCNGTYAFWGPFWCFIICGLVFGTDGYAIPWQGWVGAVVMVIGIITLAIAQDKASKEA
ncbi:hypothetical protein [Zhenpiania hominis]|uniref:EamA-like transporter family protein n=1 Tax=Zhenpiania hominis TaxID=2763644 RepID=A0A923SQJ5_9FIRM|nr:hypothetical protein [Zhenpiania hominis]MBC6679676.1 hypothetical protein [Zhenpiania hominis]